eukprot:gnl/TRDRNA2_/TRDRNA2_187204_c0_seq1.p1 gnl/TRDRNA2_/TRDRNA2_187204_c0~~gnl/TRDRNA2_/TRDRNA2_187204_c0_seq1.p1  ORF type:complete len:498 (-),score=74.53 gnl/TRDRNA2_/TRDRNA2_187204_c0_seq1:65-1558(-)
MSGMCTSHILFLSLLILALLVGPSCVGKPLLLGDLLEDSGPHIVSLRRELVPVKRGGVVVSHKTSHSGVIRVGAKGHLQEFRVVFDTGSGQVVLPSAACSDEACLVHKNYDVHTSPGAVPVNVDGSPVKPGKLCDQVTIGFGTGKVVGEFARERVCISESRCVTMNMVMAVEMSTQPFKNFNFDGILGLGLKELSLSPQFSFLHALSGSVPQKHFGVFISEDDTGSEESEIALGGTNPARFGGPLLWAPVALPELGHWQVHIKDVRIGNQSLPACQDGSCRGIVDTGTSHLGIPSAHLKHVADLLTVPVSDGETDCREVEGLTIEIELDDFTLTLSPRNYMRTLPIAANMTVGSLKEGQDVPVDTKRRTDSDDEDPDEAHAVAAPTAVALRRRCKPRVLPVRFPPPLGPNLFLLGEPVLHRYYTVYDWGEKRIGFGLAVKPEGPVADRVTAEQALPSQAEAVLTLPRAVPSEEIVLFQAVMVIALKTGVSHAAPNIC